MPLRRFNRRCVAAALGCAVCVFLLNSRPALAQEILAIVPARYVDDVPPPEPFAGNVVNTTFGLRTWVSTGHSAVSYAGIDGIPHVMSELHWRRLNNPMLELSADCLWFDRLIVRTDLGVGTSGSGRLSDKDFDVFGLTSDSEHPVSADNLYYFNLDLGWRIVCWHGFRNPDSFLAIDALIGWQYWSEKYVARDGVDQFPGNRLFPPGDVIASRFQWDSLRIGLRSVWQIHENWSLESRVFFVPYTEFQNNDIHYLRTDLLNDPSFVDRADGGIGIMADLTLAWRILPHLGVEAGYRVWDIRSEGGVSFTRTPTDDFASPLNHAYTIRHGLLLGLTWRF
jgi:Protochlamydia outer membrane protein